MFNDVYKINVNEHVETSNGFKYLSWSYAWAELKKLDPNANYEILENNEGLPFFQSSFGFFVKTTVTFKGITHKMTLPILDGRNKAMKSEAYKYQAGKNKFEFECKAVDAFDINKAILRCLVKNIAMHGLGLYIYSGEDLPEKIEDIEVVAPKKVEVKETIQPVKVADAPDSKELSDSDKETIRATLNVISSKANLLKEIENIESFYSLNAKDKEWLESLVKLMNKKLEKQDSFFINLKNKPLSDVYSEVSAILNQNSEALQKIESFTNKLFDYVTFKQPSDIYALKAFLNSKDTSLSSNQAFIDKVRNTKEKLFVMS